jgi:exonuclease III
MWNEVSDFLLKCSYLQPKDVPTAKSNELNVLSLNIRSLYKNLSNIADHVNEYQKYDVLAFNETNCIVEKLPNGINDLIIEGFHPPITQAPARLTGRGGGLAIYVHERVCSVDDVERIDLGSDHPNSDGEFLFVKIKKCKKFQKTQIIGNVYRSPSRQPHKFEDVLSSTLQLIDRHKNKHIILLGDFNIDLIKFETDSNSQRLIDTMTSYGFVQTISRPTRITDHSNTLIDHIYSNQLNKILHTNVVTYDLSDHLATTVTISLTAEFDNMQWRQHGGINPTDEFNDFRLFNETNDQKFEQLISDETWDIPDGLDAQEQYDYFVRIYTDHYNTAYPQKSKRVRRNKERISPKPWILPWLEEACDRKNRLYFTWIKSPTAANKINYKSMKAFCDKHISLAKSKYYSKFFQQHKDNSKKQWQMINSLLNRSTKKRDISKLIDNEGNVTNTPVAMAERFNEYFANIATNLKLNINTRTTVSSTEFETFLPDPVAGSMYVNPVASSEVHEIIKKMKNKATLDTRVNSLQIAGKNQKFTTIVAKIVTSSFVQGIFPQSLKLARVVPIHKNGSKTEVSNYRPISLLTIFSKIYEKLMHKRIVSFKEMNCTFYEKQYGFRAGRSCEHALLQAQHTLLNSMNKNQISLLLLIDFSKAFDMVDHSILLSKLANYGIRGVALKWLKSYLENREQFVSVNGKDSCTKPIRYGVPQGSILGPLLFVIYINDIPEIYKFAEFILYADDANIILTGQSISDINRQVTELGRALLQWVDCNGLALNLKKTNYMIFSRRKVTDEFNLIIAGVKIERKKEARFLGVIVDDKLKWTQHIKALKAKMSRYVGIMYKLKILLPVKARLQIFHSFIQSHLNFCSLVWGFSAKSNLDSLFACQKKGIRAVMPGFINYFYKEGRLPTHTKPAFNQFKLLTVHGVIAKNALIFMHKIRSFPTALPNSVKDLIASNAPSGYANHESCQEWLAEFNSTYFRNSVFFKAPLIYKDPLCKELITPSTILSIDAFKKGTKNLLLKQQLIGNEEWNPVNFAFYNVAGLRKSSRVSAQQT